MLQLVLSLGLLGIGADAFAQSTIRSDFDHDSTGFRLEGAHLATGCGDCHRKGIFEGTLRECEDCHRQGSTVTATAKPARHVLTSERCESCHAPRSFIPLVRMDHTEAFGECVSCHNNQVAPGKPIDHPPAGDNCEACHLTSTFSVVTLGLGSRTPAGSEGLSPAALEFLGRTEPAALSLRQATRGDEP
jgi:hypothetical protein